MDIEYLTIPFSDLSKAIEELKKGPGNFLSTKVTNVEELIAEIKLRDEWVLKCGSFFQSSFSRSDNFFQKGFKVAKSSQNDKITIYQDIQKSVINLRNDVASKQRLLRFMLEYIKVSDLVLNPNHPEKEKRKEFTFEEKEDFILSKLYDLYKNGFDEFVSIPEILHFNGIILNRRHEERELVRGLVDVDFVKMFAYGSGCTAKIIGEGIKYIENKRKEEQQLQAQMNKETLSFDPLDISNDTVQRAITDARTLIQENGASSGVDRIHTALHGYLREVAKQSNIQFLEDDTIAQIFKKLKKEHSVFQFNGTRQEDITYIVNSISGIIDKLSPLRNKASLSHPNETLLDEDEAMLVMDATHTVFNYLNRKFKKQNHEMLPMS